jgi:hypothetical protein
VPDSPHHLELEQALLLGERLWVQTQGDLSRVVLKLRDMLGAGNDALVREVAEIVLGRKKAREQGLEFPEGFYTRQSVEQSSRAEVAAHHAVAFSGCQHVLEICTGAGVDSIALSRTAKNVTTLELDERLSRYAQHNFKLAGTQAISVESIDAETFVNKRGVLGFDGLWADPSRRRADGSRIKEPDMYSPSLSWLMDLPVKGPIGIKISPAAEVGDRVQGDWVREVIGFEDGCIEQTLWKNTQKVDGSVFLADKNLLWIPKQEFSNAVVCDVCEPGKYILEPHAALIRSGHLGRFFNQQGISLIDEDLAWGISGAAHTAISWLRSFEVQEVGSYSPKRLARRMKELGWNSRTEIKKRAIDEDPDEVRKRLKLPAPSPSISHYGVVLLCKIRGVATYMLARRVGEKEFTEEKVRV